MRMLLALTLTLGTVLLSAPVPVAAQASRMPIVADNIVVERDVIYGRPDGAAVLADVAYPEVRKGIPAILYFHGGRWTCRGRLSGM